MDKIGEFVAHLSREQIVSFSLLLDQLNNLKTTFQGDWLIRLICDIDIDLLYTWSTKIGLLLANNLIQIQSDLQEFVELLKLRQFSLNVSHGLIDFNKLSYLQFFYQYLARTKILILVLQDKPEKFLSKLRIDDFLSGNLSYDPEISQTMAITTSEKITIQKLVEYHNSNRLRVIKVTFLSAQKIGNNIEWSSIPFPMDIYQIDPPIVKHNNPSVRFMIP